jgi:dihydroneopterin aldolase
MKSKDKLIYDLIFSDNEKYKIDISDYIEDIYKYEEFISDIKTVLKKSKVKIIKSEIKTDPKTVIWEIKVTKI